jgi:hypothetical protein
MTVEFPLAAVFSTLSLLVAVLSLWRAVKRDEKGDTAALDARIRKLEDAMIRLEGFMDTHRSVPERLTRLETHAERVDELLNLLRAHLPRLLQDIARGELR